MVDKKQSKLDAMLLQAPWRQFFVVLWWDLFNQKKYNDLLERVWAGMAWNFAYEDTKKGKPWMKI